MASIVILFVLATRLILKRAPKVFSYALWLIVLIRLLVPISVQSPVSAIPEIQTTNSFEINEALPDFDFELPSDRKENQLNLQQAIETGNPITVRVSRSLEPAQYLALGWMAGMLFMLLYSVISYQKIRRKLDVVVPLRGNIFIADDIQSPFVIGFIRPKIYLPCNLGEREQEYIILHEQHHIRRLDHIFKSLAFLALTIHWFNPLVWVAFVLACRDMEMSCDEAVIRKLGSDVRADYSASLLTLATGHRIIAGTPLAFGEGDTKGRIKNLGKWKKPTVWGVAIAFILCIILTICLLTNPYEKDAINAGITYYSGTVVDSAVSGVNESDREGRSYITLRCEDGEERLFWMAKHCEKPDMDLAGKHVVVQAKNESDTGLLVAVDISIAEKLIPESLESAIQDAILYHHRYSGDEDVLECASFFTLASETSEPAETNDIRTVTEYGIVYHQNYRLENGALIEEGGCNVPTVLTFCVDHDNQYVLTEYWEPRDGSYYLDDIRAKYPAYVWPDTQKNLFEQKIAIFSQVMEGFQVGPEVVIDHLITDICDRERWAGSFDDLMLMCELQREILACYGSHTLEYCFSQFLDGNQTSIRAEVMAAVCKQIISDGGEPLLSDAPMGPQEWFDSYLEQALSLPYEYSEDDILADYPGSYILLRMVGKISAQVDWGISLSVHNVTPTGLTIVCTQSGGTPSGELHSGSWFVIEKYDGDKWIRVEPKADGLAWNEEAWLITMNGSVEWEEGWEYVYGTLSSGQYRIGKQIYDFRETGDYDTAMCYAEFEIS